MILNRFRQAFMAMLLVALCAVSLATLPVQAGDSITLAKKDGTLVTATADDHNALFAIATWCPHCKHLVSFMKDPEIAPYTDKLHIVFVLRDEQNRVLPALENAAQEALNQGKIKPGEEKLFLDQKIAELKAKSGGPLLYVPDVLSILPGEYLFVTKESQEKSPVVMEFYPASYSVASKRFDGRPLEWILDNAGIPENLFMTKARQYGLIE